jgi:hypothetical protein
MSTPQKTQAPGDLPKALSFIFIISFMVGILIVFSYWMQFHVRLGRTLSDDPAVWGQLGDYVGGILNPVIALAALLLLAIGVRIQNQTLREAREQLALQRTELEQTREVLKRQSEEIALQSDAAQRQVFEATFFRLLESLRHLVGSYEVPPASRGITAMLHWALELRDYDSRSLMAEACTPASAADVVARWYPKHRPRLASYFALVLMILEFVEKSGRSDQIFYTDVLRATLSPGELFVLFHYGVSNGSGRFKQLAEKYGLMDGFDPTAFDLPNQRRLWYAASRIPRSYATVS